LSNQLLFYSQAVPVNSHKHKDLYIKAGNTYDFAAKVNSVPLTTVEFRPACQEYAVVFAGQGEAVIPVAVLGAEIDRNYFVDAQGAWDARYIPAFVRRYPFVFSSSEDGKNFALCIDEDFVGCNTEGRGERLFDAEGNRTQYLETVLSFVQEYQVQFQRASAFCKRLNELDLLEPMQATFTPPGGERQNLTGFLAVNRNRLKALEDDVLLAMARGDELELIYLHLQSLQNFGRMLNRVGAKAGQPAAAEGETSAAPIEGVESEALH